MAKVTNPLFSSEARGRVGGIVFNTWRGAHTVKVKISPAQPRSARQTAVRAYVTTLSKAWAVLSDAQRLAWTEWANAHPLTDWAGTKLRSTGLNVFLALNSRKLDQSLLMNPAPPTSAAPINPANMVITPGAGTMSIAFTAYGGTATQIEAYLYGPHSAGRAPTFVKAKFKQRGPAETTPLVITGLIAGLYSVYLRAVSETDGQASAFVTANTTVT